MKNQRVSSANLPPLTSIKQQTFKLKELISIRTLFQTSEKGTEYSKGTAASAELWFRFLVPLLQSSQSFSRVLALSLALCASLTLNQACSANAFTTQRTYFIWLFFSHLKLGFETALTKSHLNWRECEKIAQVLIREISWLSAASGEETTALSYKRKHQELFSPFFAPKQEIVWARFEEQSGESWGVNCAKPQGRWDWVSLHFSSSEENAPNGRCTDPKPKDRTSNLAPCLCATRGERMGKVLGLILHPW